MTSKAANLEEQARDLSPTERAWLARKLSRTPHDPTLAARAARDLIYR